MKRNFFMMLIVMSCVGVCFTSPPTAEENYQKNYQEFTARRESWIAKLRLCESGGRDTAINPRDVDGTPSYYAFQFKPETFKMYGIRYKLVNKNASHAEIMQLIKIYEFQKELVEKMTEDSRVKWSNEFPDCVKKLGYPPKLKI